MKDWKAAIRSWHARNKPKEPKGMSEIKRTAALSHKELPSEKRRERNV